jgi:hypothetical protein
MMSCAVLCCAVLTWFVCLFLSIILSVGTIPRELGSLSKLTRIHIYSNNFTGSVPTTLGSLSVLVSLRVNDNSLNSVPSELCAAPVMSALLVDANPVACFPSCLTSVATLLTGTAAEGCISYVAAAIILPLLHVHLHLTVVLACSLLLLLL